MSLALGACGLRGPAPVAPEAQAAPPRVRPLPPPAPAAAARPAAVPAPAAAPAPAALASPAPPPPDPVQALVAACERDYQSGFALYRAGRLDQARAQFDRAVDRLLASSYDLRQTPPLQAELNRLVDRVHALETSALEAGDGFTEQKPQPAPIESVAQLTFPVDAATRAEVEQQIKNTRGDLPLALTDPVIRYIHYFSTPGGREYLQASYRRAGEYRAMIERTLRQVGVPQDLIYLAQAESSFNPFCVSRAGARGIWQFMASRADDYGLKRNWWVDERQDPQKSTLAAARHLRDLYHEFGDWYLAMAAYDAGPATIQRAVAESGSADFWVLYRRGLLPQETRNYVPIIIAMALMAKNPRQYGLSRLAADPPLVDDEVVLDAPVDLRLAAECAGASVAQMQELNPSLLRLTTPNTPGFVLHLPAGTLARFRAALEKIPPDKRVLWRYHEVEPGESLYEIARRYRTTAARIAEVNNVSLDARLHAGDDLVIPVRRAAPDHMRYTRVATRYRVRRGDTLRKIAEQFGVSELALRRWNHLRGSYLRAGRILRIHLPLREHVADADFPYNVHKPKDISATPGSAFKTEAMAGGRER
ncbi:MAG TPA: transglycosylase SLT domain-containing protein [Terriglobales bacterium]|nr:transglycosylase SLT domain-containing protein [Terriglobales bacterium]